MLHEQLRLLVATARGYVVHAVGIFLLGCVHLALKRRNKIRMTVNQTEENEMQIVDQKLGNVGEVKAEIVGGKLTLSVEGDLDLVAQLEKLKAAHAGGIVADLINLAEGAIAKL